MERFQKIISVFLFFLVLVFGVFSTSSLLLLATNVERCFTTKSSEVWTQTSATTCLLVSLACLQAINLVKSVFFACQGYNQIWPSGKVLAWLLLSTFLSTTGQCMLLLHVLPRTDLLRGLALLMSFGFLPMLVQIFCSNLDGCKKTYFKPLFGLCVALQLLALVLSSLYNYTTTNYNQHENGTAQRVAISWFSFSTDSLALVGTILFVPFQWFNVYIDGDFIFLGRRKSLTNFQQQLDRCKHKANIVLPVWKILWVVVYVVAFIPNYTTGKRECPDLVQVIDDLPGKIMSSRKKLQESLARDVTHNDKTALPRKVTDWRDNYAIQRNPTHVPLQSIDDAPMMGVEEVMKWVDKYEDCSNKKSDGCQTQRKRIDAIILEGRYSKLTIKTYLQFKEYLDGSYVPETPTVNEESVGFTYKALAVLFVSCTVVTYLSAKAACLWKSTRLSYVLSAGAIVPVTMLVAMLECSYPPAYLAPVLQCTETWSHSSVVLLITCIVWAGSQLLMLVYGYNITRLETSIDFSMPFAASSLVFGASNASSTGEVMKTPLAFRYKFNFIKTKKRTSSDNESDTSEPIVIS